MSSPLPEETARLSSNAPSPALLAAAVAGLLCLSFACSSNDENSGAQNAAPGTPEAPQVTASRIEQDMTLDKFTANCSAQGGVVETHPHCGGVNSCRGFSYDVETFMLTEHTCKALNTCAGYSCVLG